jgi:ribosome-associated translation inhibitor RaiA
MHIQFSTGHEELDAGLQARIESRLQKLGRLVPGAHTTVTVVRESGSQTADALYGVSLHLTRAGFPDVYARETGATLEEAGDLAVSELKDELNRVRGKQQSLLKRGGQALKRMLRRGE